MKTPWNRRKFIAASATAGAGAVLNGTGRALAAGGGSSIGSSPGGKRPALLGGEPTRKAPFPEWPVIEASDERAWTEVLKSRRWFRGNGDRVNAFEAAYAQLTGAKHCVATANGTSALFASLGALDVGPGDEVILTPYTFVATLNVILLQHALPVFVDVDPATFQIAADKVEAAITERTTAILPVHLGGNVADMDKLLEISRRRNIPIVEDACQSHLAEWRGRKVGTLGATGCFSFQASKNLNSGEGGAILTNDPDLAERCYGFHNNGRGRGTPGAKKTHLGGRAANLRLTEFQATLLMTQMERLEAQARARERNAGRLTRLLKEIPGVRPAEQYEGCTRNAYHLYMFRVDSEAFGGLSRDGFLRALRAEGIPCSGGYGPMQRDPFIRETLKGKGYRRIFPAEVLDGWEERNQCPENDQLCREAVWFTQTMLLGPESDMDQIADAVRKIQRHGAELARA